MKRPTPEEQQELLRKRREGYAVMERLRHEQLRGMPYNAEDVAALLALGDDYDGPPRFAEGLREHRRRFQLLPDHPCNRATRRDTGSTE